MSVVKVLPKGQITIPREIRDALKVKEGDTLIMEKTAGKVVLKRGKTIFDYAGTLPNLGMTIDKLREKAAEAEAKDRE